MNRAVMVENNPAYATRKDLPVISTGMSMPIYVSIVGATSATPPWEGTAVASLGIWVAECPVGVFRQWECSGRVLVRCGHSPRGGGNVGWGEAG